MYIYIFCSLVRRFTFIFFYILLYFINTVYNIIRYVRHVSTSPKSKEWKKIFTNEYPVEIKPLDLLIY